MELKAMSLFLIYLLIMNLLAFAAMGLDKAKAKAHQWRISERRLFLFAVLGGSAGAVFGMFFFHHKTKHWKFRFGLPAILLIQLALAWKLLK